MKAKATVIASALLAMSVEAQPPLEIPCFPENVVEKMARERYGEVPVWEGVRGGGGKAILFLSDTGSWGFAIEEPSLPGMLCIAGAGRESGLVDDASPPPRPLGRGPKIGA